MQPQFFNVINDELRGSEKTHAVTDPRTEENLWPCPIASTDDFEDAVAAARKAFTTWSRTTVAERQALLVKLAEVLEQNAGELAEILARETGKSQIVASIDVNGSIAQCLYYSQNALEDEVQFEDETTKVVATHIPLGVVGAICPWNFPLILSNIKVVASLVTGNCVILKPSPFTPYAVMKWTELSRGILPPGVFQVLNGGADLGALMTLHPGIDKISFTGTTATGKRVMASCAKTLKKVTLELAGNDACIVCADADLDRAVPSVASGGFFNAGQVCVASKRIYVHESIYDDFLARLVKEVEASYAIQEDSAAPSVFGPVSNKMQFDVVKGIIEDCRANGYNIVSGAAAAASAKPATAKGFWLPPTIVSKPPENSVLVKEEQFGPILPILSWSDEDDVVRRSNLANAGLGASVYSADLAQAERIARRLEAGGVWINQFERPNFGAFFGGIKDSGFGGEMGKQGLLSYAYTQCLHFAK
ncbi:Aldehyde/histidinol dehydrogenase [Lasiosphaeria miniovina]|uniref:aldehyde dehydrogenase (NAD(+)) n=1 Tax=Lasiosphaeria miniovina TaxID=1954250 RepID=A0AA40A0E6_9PEZI|nr:Aldehyde/histidinol dehydrogenase [Lasiosphaeria miniovina]KAK0706963.1 Aldehyde/histidinol dehydrogenase [Lasiosphaeria miniovina]